MTVRLVNTNQPSINPDSLKTPVLRSGHKPYHRGQGMLWYGLGDEWLDWAAHHLPQKLQPNMFEIEVDDSRLLKLHTVADCKACVANKYGEARKSSTGYEINWDKVAKDYAGVELTRECLEEYFTLSGNSEAGPELIWLEGWDIGQGCIWDGSIIRSSKKIPTTDPRLKQIRHQSLPDRP